MGVKIEENGFFFTALLRETFLILLRPDLCTIFFPFVLFFKANSQLALENANNNHIAFLLCLVCNLQEIEAIIVIITNKMDCM